MKPKSTFILLLVFALLAGAYWSTGFFHRQKQQQVQAAKRLFEFAPEAVKMMALKRVDGPECAGERQADGTWKFTKPNPTIQPMPLVWERMAKALAGLNNERVIAEKPGNLKDYGLEEPRLTFSATIDGHDPVKLVFGSPEPTQISRFARVNDGPVILVNEKEFFELDRNLDFLRYRFLVDNREAPLVRMEFTRIWTGRDAKPESMKTAPEVGSESTKIVVVRDTADAPWRMIAPVEAAADQNAVQDLAKEVQFATADGFVDTPGDLADYGLTPANARLVVADNATGTPQTFLFGDADRSSKGRLFAKREGKDAVFTLEGTLLGKLPRVPDAFRERRLLTQQAKDIVRIDYTSNASSFTLVRGEKDAWSLEGVAMNDISQERTSLFIAQLKATAMQTFVDANAAAGAGLENPDVTVKITLKDDPSPREIRLKANAADAAMFYARQDTGAVGMLGADRVKGLLVSPDSFRSLGLMRFDKNEAVKISFMVDGKPYEFEKVHGLWVVRQPENYRLSNQSDAESILAAFMKLDASGNAQVSPTPAENPGLEAPVIAITITTQAQDGTQTAHGPLNVGRALPAQTGERYCSIAGREGLFAVKADVVDKVRDALHGVIANPSAQ